MTTQSQRALDHVTIEQCLTAVGLDASRWDAWERLGNGASGAGVFRVRLDGVDAILKVTPPGSGDVQRGGQRELHAYRSLLPGLAIPAPRLIAGGMDESVGTVLLLSYCRPVLGPSAWTAERFALAAELAADLHAVFWGRTSDLAAMRWLRQPDQVSNAGIADAWAMWRRLAEDPRFGEVLTASRLGWVRRELDRLRDAPVGREAIPVTVVHGDFHAGNILLDGAGTMVLADWQEVGVGWGPDDLSFLVQRAGADGAVVPLDSMVAAYRDRIRDRTGTTIPAGVVERRMERAELWTRLLHWPAFLSAAPASVLEAHVARSETLVAGE